MSTSSKSIAEVELETGVSKDQLRVWERRYGFPEPFRNQYGERVYPDEQVSKLKVVRRLLDRGMRPGRVLALSASELAALADSGKAAEVTPAQDLALYLLRTHQTNELRRELAQSLVREGLFRFITETAAPLTNLVGEAWMRGELRVFEEHLFSELLQGLLRTAIAQCSAPGGTPVILLTTLPSEQHALGMLMAEAACVLEGAECITLGVQTPLADILAGATANTAHVVALSFSANFPAASLAESVHALRRELAPQIALWCGGAGAARLKRPPVGVRLLHGLEVIGPAIAEWRAVANETKPRE